MDIKKLYPGGNKKAFTLSYDDGVRQDIAFISVINRYHLKCTFNINSGRFSSAGNWTTVPTNRISEKEARTLYYGHEVAVHTVNHPTLTNLSREEIYREVKDDMEKLSEVAGYPVRGMAYPNGKYNDEVISVLTECGIAYSRTTKATMSFALPENPLSLHPTCHHKVSNIYELLESFKNTDEELALFFLWGHSYEFDTKRTWEDLEDICSFASKIRHCWFATNIEIFDYINAFKKLEICDDSVKNHSDMALWLDVDGELIRLDPGCEYKK